MRRPLVRSRSVTIRVFLAGVLFVFLAACRQRSSVPEDEATAAPEAGEPVMLVGAAKAVVAPIREELRLLGRTVALRHITIRAPAAGRVTGLKLKIGGVVRRGQVVAHIITRETEAARAGLEVARKLDPEDIPALTRSLKRVSDGAGIPVVVTSGGVVADRPVASGQVVAYLDSLAKLIDPASIYVEAAVPVGDLRRIRPGMTAIVTSPLRPGVEFRTRVAALMPSFIAKSATSPARLEFTGKERITEAGAPVEVRVIVARVAKATVIPKRALFQSSLSGRFHVFVAGPDGRAHRIDVTLGVRAPHVVQVTSGVQPGEEVITSGGYALSDGLRVRIADARR